MSCAFLYARCPPVKARRKGLVRVSVVWSRGQGTSVSSRLPPRNTRRSSSVDRTWYKARKDLVQLVLGDDVRHDAEGFNHGQSQLHTRT